MPELIQFKHHINSLSIPSTVSTVSVVSTDHGARSKETRWHGLCLGGPHSSTHIPRRLVATVETYKFPPCQRCRSCRRCCRRGDCHCVLVVVFVFLWRRFRFFLQRRRFSFFGIRSLSVKTLVEGTSGHGRTPIVSQINRFVSLFQSLFFSQPMAVEEEEGFSLVAQGWLRILWRRLVVRWFRQWC